MKTWPVSAHIGGIMLHRKLLIGLVAACLANVAAAQSFPVKIDVDARAAGAGLTPIWRFFGADEPNYATMKDGRALLAELGALRPGEVFFRAHKSRLVNLHHVKAIVPWFGGRYKLVMRNPAASEVELSRAQARILRRRMHW